MIAALAAPLPTRAGWRGSGWQGRGWGWRGGWVGPGWGMGRLGRRGVAPPPVVAGPPVVLAPPPMVCAPPATFSPGSGFGRACNADAYRCPLTASVPPACGARAPRTSAAASSAPPGGSAGAVYGTRRTKTRTPAALLSHSRVRLRPIRAAPAFPTPGKRNCAILRT